LKRNDQTAFAVWITGLPASGKSTLAVELARQIRARWPEIPVGLVTGWGEDLTTEQRRAVQGVLTKPATREALQRFLRTLVAQREPAPV